MKKGYHNPADNRRTSERKHRLNEEIRVAQVRVIDAENAMLGIMPVSEAIKLAEERKLDLIEIAPQADPPVCKIFDYGKFVYELQKREKIQKKAQHQQQMKEIRFKWRIDDHDFNFKLRHAKEFIIDGNKVKATVFFRGREIVHQEIGQEVLERFVKEMMEVAKVDQPIKPEGKSLSVVLAPEKIKPEKPKKKVETPSE